MKFKDTLCAWDSYVLHPTVPNVYVCVGIQCASPNIEHLNCIREGVDVVPTPIGTVGFDDGHDEIDYNMTPYEDYIFVKPRRWVRRFPMENHEYRYKEVEPYILGIYKGFVEEF